MTERKNRDTISRIAQLESSNDEARMTKEARSTNDRKEKPRYDLEDRTTRFGEAIIDFAKAVPVSPITEPLLKQLVRAGTSIGANYAEADDAASRKDFRYRIGICKRESRETKYWLRMVAKAAPELAERARANWSEAKELHLIFARIFRGKSKDPPE
jgi:four helix bundle protein